MLPGQTGDTTVGSRTYKLDHTDTIRAGRGLKVTDEERYPITGFTCNTDVSTKNGQSYNGAKFYYTRNSYDLVFISGGKTVKTESVKYQASIADYASNKPGNAPAGMEDYVFAVGTPARNAPARLTTSPARPCPPTTLPCTPSGWLPPIR